MASLKPPQQIPLDLSPQKAMRFETFLACESQINIVKRLQEWQNWPSPILLLFGEAGVGKTHLGTAFAVQSADVRFVDDAHQCGEAELFAQMNTALTGEVSALLLAAPTHPRLWTTALPDLRSRLNNTPTAELLPPGDSVLEGITRQLFEGYGRLVSKDVVTYIVSRTARTVPALHAVVTRLEMRAQADKADMTKAYAARHIGKWSEPDFFEDD